MHRNFGIGTLAHVDQYCHKLSGPLVLVTQQNGVTVIPQPTPLTRLNYFDGKFLRASDLSAEQLYLRRLVDLSNQAGAPGVAHGFNLSLAASGDILNLGPGLAVDKGACSPPPPPAARREADDTAKSAKNEIWLVDLDSNQDQRNQSPRFYR